MRAYVLVPSLALVLFLASCIGGRSPSARFFQLQPAPQLSPAGSPLDPAILVVVKPVSLESYLRQPQMADRVTDHEVTYNEFARWAEPLDRNITRVITENLRRLLQTDKIAVAPQINVDGRIVTVLLEIKRFEPQPDGKAHLSAAWGLDLEPGESVPRVGSADLSAPVEGKTPEQIAAAQSRLLSELSRRLASEITAMIGSAGPADAGK